MKWNYNLRDNRSIFHMPIVRFTLRIFRQTHQIISWHFYKEHQEKRIQKKNGRQILFASNIQTHRETHLIDLMKNSRRNGSPKKCKWLKNEIMLLHYWKTAKMQTKTATLIHGASPIHSYTTLLWKQFHLFIFVSIEYGHYKAKKKS